MATKAKVLKTKDIKAGKTAYSVSLRIGNPKDEYAVTVVENTLYIKTAPYVLKKARRFYSCEKDRLFMFTTNTAPCLIQELYLSAVNDFAAFEVKDYVRYDKTFTSKKAAARFAAYLRRTYPNFSSLPERLRVYSVYHWSRNYNI